MVQFLSTEWIEALDEAGRTSPNDADPESPDDGAAINIEQRVTTEGAAEIVYTLSVSANGIRVRSGAAEGAHVTFTLARPTAVAIAMGTQSAQAAFMAGDLRIGGDTSILLRSPDAFAALGDRFEAVREITEW